MMTRKVSHDNGCKIFDKESVTLKLIRSRKGKEDWQKYLTLTREKLRRERTILRRERFSLKKKP